MKGKEEGEEGEGGEGAGGAGVGGAELLCGLLIAGGLAVVVGLLSLTLPNRAAVEYRVVERS